MKKQRKQYLDDLWMNSEVGRWTKAVSVGDKKESDKILNELFKTGYLNPLEYLMEQEKELCREIRKELKDASEGRAYVLALEEKNCELVDVMVAYEFSILDLYYQ
mgnify:CR=1 FL=1